MRHVIFYVHKTRRKANVWKCIVKKKRIECIICAVMAVGSKYSVLMDFNEDSFVLVCSVWKTMELYGTEKDDIYRLGILRQLYRASPNLF